MIGRFATREYAINVAGRTIRVLGPAHPDELLDDPDVERRHRQDDYMPYWATPWPSAVMLAEFVLDRLEPATGPVLEVGAGLGVVGAALAAAGHRVVVTDYDAEALLFCRANADLNGVRFDAVELLDFRSPPAAQYPVIVGADVLYEQRHHRPVLGLLDAMLARHGTAWFCDPDRGAARGFPELARASGWQVAALPITTAPIPATDSVRQRPVEGTVFELRYG